jgi:hypothetical protein
MNNKEQEEKFVGVGATKKINFFMSLTFNNAFRQ